LIITTVFYNSGGAELIPNETTTTSTATLTVSGLTNDGGSNGFGSYYMRSLVSNQYGSIAQSSYLVVTVDTQSPSTPQTPDLNPESDTGNSTTDDLTNDNTPSISSFFR